MAIDSAIIQKIAHLARLTVNLEEEQELVQSLNQILSWMDKLNELDTTHTDPLIHISSELNVLREDKLGEHLPHDAALLNAPKRDSDYFRVPKVIE
jgi:aspartyl-tRNA(Asn)/glutamyl-tRNA(Gln) amidotransferase subunit C